MSIAVLFGCASSASEEEGALQEEQKADRGFGECSAAAVATAAAALPNDATAAAAREGAKMGAGGREGTGKEGPPEQSRAGFVLDKRRTTDGQFWRWIRGFNYLEAAVRLIAAWV